MRSTWGRLSACGRVVNPPKRRLPPGAQLDKLPHTPAVLAAAIFLAGCGRYGDFTLPPPPGGPPPKSFAWKVTPEPVLERGRAGAWDAVDTLNPSIVDRGGLLFNFYSGFDGRTWHTGLATSSDGIDWVRGGRVLSPDPATWEGRYIAANGSALFVNGEFLYWYQAGEPPRIGLARSPDGKHWEKVARPVLELGPRLSWDERAVADPYVILAGGRFFLFYLGSDRTRRQRLGVATSKDGVLWWKLRSNPILELGAPGEFDEGGLGEPAVWAADGRWWMLYTGRDRKEVRRIGLAVSTDGVRWERFPGVLLSSGQRWNSKVVCDPSVLPGSSEIRVWFGGGDDAHPAERIDGQIGYAALKPLY